MSLNHYVTASFLAVLSCCAPGWAATSDTLGSPTIEFEGFKWTGQDLESLTVKPHRNQTALCIRVNSQDSVAQLSGIEFTEGVVEMDLASVGRSYPTVALRISKDQSSFDRLILNPWPRFKGEPERRLREAIVTPGDSHSTLLNFHLGRQGAFDSESWFHVRLVMRRTYFQVFINDDTEPAFAMSNRTAKHHGLGIGLCGSNCFVRNVVITPAKSTAGRASLNRLEK